MSSIRAELTGDTNELIKRLGNLGNADMRGVLNSIGEGLRTSTVERFTKEKTPEGKGWKTSARAKETGGKTLTKTAAMKSSIHSVANSTGVAVGTNDIRAAIHQFGGTISAKNKKSLCFKVGDTKVKVKSVKIPARPFLGISSGDEREIRETLEELFEE